MSQENFESLKQSISKRFERQEEMIYGIKVSQMEIRKQLRDLQLAKGKSDENQDIELQQVQSEERKDKLERIECTERKLEVLYARVDSLERLSLRDRSGIGESEALGSSQEQVEIEAGKWDRIKTKGNEFFKSISIPGISHIVTTKNYLLKLVWIVLILVIFGFGVQNISLAVIDYYNYDKITNIERVTPQNVTFPAITACFKGYNQSYYYKNNSVNITFVNSLSLNVSLIKNFINQSFFFKTNEKNFGNHLDFFTIPRLDLDCFRFNAATNKSVELFKTSSYEDYFRVYFRKYFIEDINVNLNEYFKYTLTYLYFYIGENHLNSFEKPEKWMLDNYNHIKFKKDSTETKLPPPFNPCQESSDGKPYHRLNCIEACVAKETKNKFDCTFPSSLFAILGYKRCDYIINNTVINWQRFFEGCKKECDLEGCYSEKFTYDVLSDNGLPSDKENNIALDFSFRDLSTLNITQIPKTDPFTFLNNIGGGLGLFMGIAFPNLIEFLQFIVEIFVIVFAR